MGLLIVRRVGLGVFPESFKPHHEGYYASLDSGDPADSRDDEYSDQSDEECFGSSG